MIVGVIAIVGLGGDGLRGHVVIRVLPGGQHYPNLRSEPAFKLILQETETHNRLHPDTHKEKFQTSKTKLVIVTQNKYRNSRPKELL